MDLRVLQKSFKVTKMLLQKLGDFNMLMRKGICRISQNFLGFWDFNFQFFNQFSVCRFNWGLTVRRKSEKILKLLGDRSLLKEERNRARTVTRGIQGFGSFHHVSTNDSGQEVLKESSFRAFDKCNSQFHEHGNQEEEGFSALKKPYFAESKQGKTEQIKNEMESLISRTSFKENMAPKWDSTEESNLLLSEEKKSNSRLSISMADEEHPFNSTEHIASVSLLSTTDRILQACWEHCMGGRVCPLSSLYAHHFSWK